MNQKSDGTKELQKTLVVDQLNQGIERLAKQVSWYRTLIIGIGVVAVLMAVLAIFSFAKASSDLTVVRANYREELEETRQSIIKSMFSVSEAIESNTPTRSKRLEVYMKRAKAVVLMFATPEEAGMTDESLDQMLVKNFELSEQYMISPYEFLAYCAAESDFRADAVSPTGAKGIVQFIPSTMRIVLGEDYKPGIEFDPTWSCIAWYKYWSVLNEAMGGDRKWTAAMYQTGHYAYEAKMSGVSLDGYMKWVTREKQPFNNPYHPHHIEDLFHTFTTYGFANMSN